MRDYSKLIEQAAEQGPDVNEAVTTGGGTREPAAAGLVRLRFINYIEIGEHMDGKKGEEKRKPLVKFTFELSGPKHPATKLDDGRLIPQTITFTLNISRNEKAMYYKLFKKMNWQGKHKVFPQMIGEAFLGTVVHRVSGEGENKKVFANLRDEGGYLIRSPHHENLEGESVLVEVDAPINTPKVFMWDFCDREMWDDLFIDGRYDDKKDEAGNVIKEGTSKNYWQNLIKSALNFEGSPIWTLLSGGDSLNLPEATAPARTEEAKEASAAAKVSTPAAENDEDPLAAVAA